MVSGMDGMPMPGGWALSIAMMAAMMLPSSIPLLWRYHQGVGDAGPARRTRLTLFAAAGYFLVWSAFGAAAVPLGGVVAAIGMRQPLLMRTAPIAAAVVVLLAGCLQLTTWKARRLACLAATPGGAGRGMTKAGSAWRHGLRLGVDCLWCCAGLMAIPLVVGVMDFGVMAAVIAAITAERLAPPAMRVERAIGIVVVAAGLCMIARAVVG